MVVPPWLEELLKTEFFSVCRIHGDGARSECNMFCLDCNNKRIGTSIAAAAAAFCYYCCSSTHKDHRVIQIRRSSYHDVVRVSEIQKVLDIGGVQTYVINSARVLFLNERPQPKSAKAVSHLCEICSRSLLDPFRFCSLGCKVAGIRKNGNASFVCLEGKNGDQQEEDEDDELREGSEQDIYPLTPPPPLISTSRRKGIPHRAPFPS